MSLCIPKNEELLRTEEPLGSKLHTSYTFRHCLSIKDDKMHLQYVQYQKIKCNLQDKNEYKNLNNDKYSIEHTQN